MRRENMRARLLLVILVLLIGSAPATATDRCRDAGQEGRQVSYVLDSERQKDGPIVLTLLPDCRFESNGEQGTYEYNEGRDTFTFNTVTLPWGQTAVLHRDTTITFSKLTGDVADITTLRRKRGWSLCPLWPICTSDE
jgi:hypothetical protein